MRWNHPKVNLKTSHPPAAATPPITSCRRKKKDDANFLEDLKDHIDEFVNASMDEHKTCFKKTMQKMFGMSKILLRGVLAPRKLKVLCLLEQQWQTRICSRIFW
ncbi:hypothetical protein Prudu_021609 [Prunus dulcis]|uniref:Uncharacterized protein n=1 Tax=Prunus dulcis TaxID=3755 RepID=A0A4Y1RXS3_PRUDU|nr:hypothetical protein Prudu_021609 [Prunus dulcis]